MKVVSCILIGWSAALSKHEAFSHFTSFMRVVHFASPAQSWAIPPRSDNDYVMISIICS